MPKLAIRHAVTHSLRCFRLSVFAILLEANQVETVENRISREYIGSQFI